MSALELDADLVVVGFGAAAAATALTAAAAGASVLVLEKQTEDAHTPNTRMSGGVIMTVSDPVAAGGYLHACGGGMLTEDVCQAWADRAAGLLDWLAEIGAAEELALVRIAGAEQDFAGAAAIDCHMQGRPNAAAADPEESASLIAAGLGRGSPDRRTGRDLYRVLRRLVGAQRSVRVEWGTAASHLLRDEAGRVVGVEADVDGGTARARARAGVVLACGGYEFDPELRRNYLKADPIYFYGNPGNTGDGIRMAQEVGADLWHMNQMIGRGVGRFLDADGVEQIFQFRMPPGGYVITDRHGRRFASEQPQAESKHAYYYHLIAYDPDRREYPRLPSYWFFDRRRIEGGMLTSPVSGRVGVGLYDWSDDNRREVEAGWIAEGADIAAAAAAAGVDDPGAAAATVAAYNEACEAGEDPFGRPAETMVPLDSPPFYCVPLYPGGSNTSGGPRRDGRSRVLGVGGAPIPGLFCAGELGSPMALLYPADGSNLSEAFCFGQIAAETALEEMEAANGRA
jgi:succinate dehydrogenase/fumarate reductase flavoprotein subunit